MKNQEYPFQLRTIILIILNYDNMHLWSYLYK